MAMRIYELRMILSIQRQQSSYLLSSARIEDAKESEAGSLQQPRLGHANQVAHAFSCERMLFEQARTHSSSPWVMTEAQPSSNSSAISPINFPLSSDSLPFALTSTCSVRK